MLFTYKIKGTKGLGRGFGGEGRKVGGTKQTRKKQKKRRRIKESGEPGVLQSDQMYQTLEN